MSAQAFTPTTFALPISSGLLAHCQTIGIAIWVFLWMIDRTTKEVLTTDGCSEGLVYGGKAVRAHEIGQDLGMKTRTVHAHIELLIREGYLRRIDYGEGLPSGYAVAKSKKWRHRPVQTIDEEPSTTPQNPANPRRKTLGGSQNSALPSQNSAPYKEDNTRTLQGLSIVEEKSFDAKGLLFAPPLEVKDDSERRVNDVWDYYLERTGKSPVQYLFNRERQKQGLKGFESLVAFAKRCGSPDPPDAASQLFRAAVDRLADSPFHNGKNDRGTRYLDWHQLFSGKGYPSPSKLVEFWLDDARWGK